MVFPELSLTGYELDLAAELAFLENDPRLRTLLGTCNVHRVTCIVGAPVRVGPSLHIGAFVLSPDGTVEVYTKRHLGAGEETMIQPGSLDPLLGVGGRPAAIAVCADANRPSHPREAARRGASTYLVSTFITPSELAGKTANLRAYAMRHSMTVVFANYGGPSGGLASGGRSAIWADDGDLLVQLDGTGAGLAVAIESETGWRGKALELGDT